MSSSFLRLALPFAVLALVSPSLALAQKGKGDTTAEPSGPVVIPGGSVSATYASLNRARMCSAAIA